MVNTSQIESHCSSKDVETYKHCVDLAKRRVTTLNEGFSMLCCGIILLHIVDHLHTTKWENMYKLMIYPVVKTFENRRKNKRSDYVLMRLVKKRCVIVFDLKLSVGTVISACEDSLAQLFLDVKYTEEKERSCTTMVCVLADHENWHILLIDLLRLLFELLQYYFLHNPKMEILCSLIKKLTTDIH